MDGGVFRKGGLDAGVLGFVHDMKAPISLLRQLGLSLDMEMSEGERRQVAQEIVATSERALRQVMDLLKVARLDEAMFYMEPVSVRGVVEAATREAEGYFAGAGERVRRKFSGKVRLVSANRELLGSIIGNFLTNAAKHSEKAEVLVRETEGRVRIAVRDFGPGVSERVYRAVNTGVNEPFITATRPGSSGIGLYAASRFAEFMNGRIGVTRHRDGAEFFVDLLPSAQMGLGL
jgi:signal transduction histidine kinase